MGRSIRSIKLEVKVTGVGQAMEKLKKVGEYVEEEISHDVTVATFNAMGRLFEQNFDSGGKYVGGWRSLAPKTVEDRQRKGFGGSSPILIRYHDLRTVTATTLKVLNGSTSYSARDADGGNIRVEVFVNDHQTSGGSGGGYAQAFGSKAVLQTGEPSNNLPPRPYWFVNNTVRYQAHKYATEVVAEKIKKF